MIRGGGRGGMKNEEHEESGAYEETREEDSLASSLFILHVYDLSQ